MNFNAHRAICVISTRRLDSISKKSTDCCVRSQLRISGTHIFSWSKAVIHLWISLLWNLVRTRRHFSRFVKYRREPVCKWPSYILRRMTKGKFPAQWRCSLWEECQKHATTIVSQFRQSSSGHIKFLAGGAFLTIKKFQSLFLRIKESDPTSVSLDALQINYWRIKTGSIALGSAVATFIMMETAGLRVEHWKISRRLAAILELRRKFYKKEGW